MRNIHPVCLVRINECGDLIGGECKQGHNDNNNALFHYTDDTSHVCLVMSQRGRIRGFGRSARWWHSMSWLWRTCRTDQETLWEQAVVPVSYWLTLTMTWWCHKGPWDFWYRHYRVKGRNWTESRCSTSSSWIMANKWKRWQLGCGWDHGGIGLLDIGYLISHQL